MKFEDCKSKAEQLRFMREKLANDPRWVVRGLLTIYAYQTEEERQAEAVVEHNGVGFNGSDAQYLSSIAMQMINRGVDEGLRRPGVFKIYQYISQAQWPHVNKKMQKYAEQLCRVARDKIAQKEQQKLI